MRKSVFYVLVILIIQSCSSQNNDLSDWASDLDYISKSLPKKHNDFFVLKSKDYFLKGIQNIKSSTDSLSDLHISLKLQQLIAGMGDSHTKVHFRQFIDENKVLPLDLYWFRDGLYILGTTPEHEEILGYRLIAINQRPIKTIIDSLNTLITVDNQAIVKSTTPKLLPLVQVLEYFNFFNGLQIDLGLEDMYGEKKSYSIKPALMENIKSFEPDTMAMCYKNNKTFFVDYYLPDDKIYYIQYNKCWSKELELKYRNGMGAAQMPSFKNFEEQVFHNLGTKQIDKIVFDLRFNGGGNSSQGTSFIEKLARFAKMHPKKRIFVVLGKFTFSSAILNAMDFKRLTNATFVGEETGGKPNHFGEIRNFKLPFSGLQVDYSTKYFKRTDQNDKSLIPDIKIESDFNDYKNGKDPVFEWIRVQ